MRNCCIIEKKNDSTGERKMQYKDLAADLGRTCRACLTQKYGLHLQPKHCDYLFYPEVCWQCGERKNIVDSLFFFGRLQVAFTRKK